MKRLFPSSLTSSFHAERGSSFANAKLDRSRSIPASSRTARDNRVLSVPYSIASARLFPFLIVLLGLSAAAQTRPSAAKRPPQTTTYKLIEVKVTGSKRFTSEEVAAASGLPVGTVAHEEDFKKAARQLGETGAFSNIAYTFAYSSAGTKLEFQVIDANKFVFARFTDFVWFTDEELLQKIHERIPLFKGELPANGRLPDQVSDVLQALLVENGIPGRVEYLRNNDKSDHLVSIVYNVAGVSIRIHHAEFPGAAADELPLLHAAAEKITDLEYSREFMTNFIDHTLLPIFHEHGYLKARCAAEPTVIKPAASDPSDNRPKPTFVDLTFAVTPGLQYKLTRWNWSGNKTIPSQQLDTFLHAKTGQAANTVQLDSDLHAIQELYGARGNILATIKVDAEFDDAATVIYHLMVNEGAVFHMGELEFRGLDNNYSARLRAAWKLRPGDVYDATYLKQFLPEARKLLPAALDWDVATHVTALVGSKTVDVDLQYTAKAPQ